MSTQENKELMRQIFEEWNVIKGDATKTLSLYDKYYSPHFIYHDVSGEDMNLKKAIQDSASSISAFPDVNYNIDDLLAEGDKIVIRFTMQATHKGRFMGIPATGKLIMVKGVEIDKIAGGKIEETWDFLDTWGMMVQLGIIPSVDLKR